MLKFGSLWEIDKNFGNVIKVKRDKIRSIPGMTKEEHNCIYRRNGNTYTCVLCDSMFVLAPLSTSMETLGNFRFAI